MVKMLDSRSRGLEFKTARWLQDQLKLLPFRGRLSEYQEVLGTKSKLSPHNDSVILRQLQPIHKKGPYSLFFLIVHIYSKIRCNPTPQTYSNYKGIVTLQIILLHNTLTKTELEGCVYYNFASLFLSLKESTHGTGEKCFLFHFKSSFHSRENQILEFQILKFHDVIKFLSIKQEIHFTE